MSYLETTNSDGYETAPVELAERITQLTEQLELKGHEVKKLETNMEEVTGAMQCKRVIYVSLSSCIYMHRQLYFILAIPLSVADVSHCAVSLSAQTSHAFL